MLIILRPPPTKFAMYEKYDTKITFQSTLPVSDSNSCLLYNTK